jgi:hypothetical protein
MTTIESAATTIQMSAAEYEVEEAQLAAISFLVRYSGRTQSIISACTSGTPWVGELRRRSAAGDRGVVHEALVCEFLSVCVVSWRQGGEDSAVVGCETLLSALGRQ